METEKMELKELCTKEQFVKTLRKWADAIDKRQEMKVVVRGKENTIPPGVADQAKLEVEYEINKGEYEFEMTMKWR